jgi:hypothetical protein
MRRILLTLVLSLLPGLAAAQGVLLQGGPTTDGHAPMYVGNQSPGSQTVVQDSGPASGGGTGLGLAELLLVARGTGTPPYVAQGTGPFGSNACDYDAPTSNPTGYHYFCFGPNTSLGGPSIIVGYGGGASPLPFTIDVNGINYPFPASLSELIIGTTPVVGGSNGNCLTISGAVVGQQACGTSSITQLTGDVTALGPGSAAATLATVNMNAGTFGSASFVPTITVNGKGLVTAVTNAAISIPGTQLTGTILASNIITSSLTAVGTLGTGVWQAGVIAPAYGGTGANNGASTLTLAASLATTGSGAESLAFPTASGFTYTFQASSDTIVGRATTDTLTNKTLTSPAINSGSFAGGAWSGTWTGAPTLSGANFVSNANLAQAGAATIKGNPTNGTANVQDFTVQGLVDISSPNTTLDWIPIYNHTTGTFEKVNAAELTTAVGSGVTSLNTLSGVLNIVGVAGASVSAASTTITVSAAYHQGIIAANAGAI